MCMTKVNSTRYWDNVQISQEEGDEKLEDETVSFQCSIVGANFQLLPT